MSPFDLVLTPTGLRFMGQRYPCTIGRGGIRADKHEGDGATPVGQHRITGMLCRPDRMARPAPWAEAALAWLATAKASCASRVTPWRRATFSAVSPMLM